jgi:N-acetylneuraminic acid mutarotase
MKTKLLVLIAVLFLYAGVHAQNYTWSKQADLPMATYSAASFSIGDTVYSVSGMIANPLGPRILSSQLWAYNRNTNTWTRKADFPGTAFYGGKGFAINGKGYVVNGWDANGSTSYANSTLWQYDPGTDTWISKAVFPGTARYTSAAFVLNNKGYIACGFSPYVNDMYCYDPTSNSWSAKANFPGIARQALASFVIGGEAYVGLGATGDNHGSYFTNNDMYKYNDVTDTWTRISDLPANAVSSPYAFALGGEGYIVNGLDQSNYTYNTGASNRVWKYTPSTDTWSLWGVFPDTAIFEGISTECGGNGFMGGGAANWFTYPFSRLFYRFGPGTAPYSCTVSINHYAYNNAQFNFQATGNFSPSAVISWSFGDGGTATGTSVTHNYTSTGTFHITAQVTDTVTGCSDVATDSVSVSGLNNCSVVLNSVHFGATFNLSATVFSGAGPYQYQWSSSTDPSFSSNSPDPVVIVPLNTPASYCVTVTDTTGCVATACKTVVDSQVVYSPCQIFFVVYPDSVANGWYYGILYTQGTNLTYTWDFGDGFTSNQMLPSHTYATPGRYILCLTVSDGAGCSYTYCDSAFYAYKNGGGPMSHFSARSRYLLGVNDITEQSHLGIYPNPAMDVLTIDALGQRVDAISIYNTSGQLISEQKAPAQNKVNIAALPAGIYFMDVKVNEISTKVKFVKAN